MPYIPKEERTKFDDAVRNLPTFESKGELEYIVTILMHKFMENRVARYTNLHDCVYAVVHAADEFRRHTLDKREDQAIEDNGQVKLSDHPQEPDDADNV